LYGVAGLYTFVRVVQLRRSFFDGIVTNDDIALAWAVSIFLLTPVGVLAHELGHYVTADYFGASDIELHHRGYWGFVSYSVSAGFSETKSLIVTGSGPLVGVLVGYLSLAIGALLPRRVIFRYLLASFGVLSIFHSLIGYPLIDALSQSEGDFYNIYTSLTKSGLVVVGSIHAALLGFFVLIWRRSPIQDIMSSSSSGLSVVIQNGGWRNIKREEPRRFRFPSIAGLGSSWWIVVGIAGGFAAAIVLFPVLPKELTTRIEKFHSNPLVENSARPELNADLTGMIAWLDASALSEPADGKRVSMLPDRSGNNNDAVQSSSEKSPRIDVNGLNGLPVLVFDGEDDVMAMPRLHLGSQITIFFVVMDVAQTTEGSIHRGILTANNDPYRADGSGYGFGYSRGGSDGFRVNPPDGASGGLLQHLRPSTNRYEQITYLHSLNVGLLRRNGTVVALDDQDANNASHVGYDLGAQTSFPSRYYRGGIGEVMIFDRALSDPEIVFVEIYLTSKWGIPY